jgi:hypothetical protein
VVNVSLVLVVVLVFFYILLKGPIAQLLDPSVLHSLREK